ncbi:MAG TPA: substrate-binding domain-containing protein [Acidimicrobiia bacterium]
MKRTKIIGLIAVLAMLVAACGGDDAGDTTTTAGTDEPTTTEAMDGTTTSEAMDDTTTTAGGDDNPLAEFNEDPTSADPALVEKALGPVEPSDEDSWNIVLASIARATQDIDQETLDVAMTCWNETECDTGSGGELVMGYADGGGKTVNVWRGVSRMEAILQALTYEEIGKIVTTEANFDQDPAVHINGINFLVQYPVDFIVGYPDFGAALAPAVQAAEAAGIPYISFSAGYVGLPGSEGALTPGTDYTAVVGENLCELGNSFAEVLTTNVAEGGEVGLLGGTPNNALTLGWQQCIIPSVTDGGLAVANPPPNENTTTGDTFWVNSFALDAVRGLLTTNPEIQGWAYEYSDGLFTALQAYDELNIPVENLSVALRTDEQTLFCDWAERNEPTYNIWFSAGGNFQSRTGVTAAMLALQGADVPGEVVVPHVMRQVTADDCNPDRVNDVVSGTSLVPDAVLAEMYGGG